MTDKYKEYLKSDKWKKIKEKLFSSRGKKCERCTSTFKIEVHHKTYENIYNEKLEDLEVLCKICHTKHHKKEKKLKLEKSFTRMPFGKYKGKLLKYIKKDNPKYLKFIYSKLEKGYQEEITKLRKGHKC